MLVVAGMQVMRWQRCNCWYNAYVMQVPRQPTIMAKALTVNFHAAVSGMWVRDAESRSEIPCAVFKFGSDIHLQTLPASRTSGCAEVRPSGQASRSSIAQPSGLDGGPGCSPASVAVVATATCSPFSFCRAATARSAATGAAILLAGNVAWQASSSTAAVAVPSACTGCTWHL